MTTTAGGARVALGSVVALAGALIAFGCMVGAVNSISVLEQSQSSKANFVEATSILSTMWCMYTLVAVTINPNLDAITSLMLIRLGGAALLLLFWFVCMCVLIDLADFFKDQIRYMEQWSSRDDKLLTEFRHARNASIVSAVLSAGLTLLWGVLTRVMFSRWWTLEAGTQVSVGDDGSRLQQYQPDDERGQPLAKVRSKVAKPPKDLDLEDGEESGEGEGEEEEAEEEEEEEGGEGKGMEDVESGSDEEIQKARPGKEGENVAL